MENKIIYFDHAANTSPFLDVLSTFNKVNEEYIANPSSIHQEGVKALRLLSLARTQILDLLDLNNHEVILTSGATEANNLAIQGYCLKYRSRGKHIITSTIEHPSVLETFRYLETQGFDVSYVKPNVKGEITLENIKNEIKKDTIFVSIMAVNNETGTINEIEKIAAYLSSFPKIAFHTDAVQAIGKIRINFKDVDFISVAGHKIHALNGSGFLIKNKSLAINPLFYGGGQENGLRSGSNDLANATSLAKALRLSFQNLDRNYQHIKKLHDNLISYLLNNPSLYHINSLSNNPYIVNFSLLNAKASVIVESLSNAHIMVSSTSACHAHGEKGSYVIKEIFNDNLLANNTIRLSFDASNNLEEIKSFISLLDKFVHEVKK